MAPMLTRHERHRQRDENKKELTDVVKKSDEIIARKIDPIQKRLESIKKQIVLLHEKKQEVMERPISKEEFIKLATDQILTQKEGFIEFNVKPHLEECRMGNIPPFSSMNRFALKDSNIASLFAFAITEDDIKKVLDPLPEIGISQKERDSQIKKIDNEIKRLTESLEDELAEIKK